MRDFTYVDDVVEANLRPPRRRSPPGPCSTSRAVSATTVNEVLDLLGEISGKEVLVKHGALMPGDTSRTGGSTDAFRAATGWTPRTPLRDGLEEQYRCVAAEPA